MKSYEDIKARVKELESEQKAIWKDDKPFKNDRIENVEISLKTLKWVMRSSDRSKETCPHTHVREIQGGQVEKCLDCGKLF